MRVRGTSLFHVQKRGLRRSEVRELDQEIRKLLENPELGKPGEEELEDVRYHRYQGKYGRMLLAYQPLPQELRLLVIVQISLKI